jgi:hypothetical protein
VSNYIFSIERILALIYDFQPLFHEPESVADADFEVVVDGGWQEISSRRIEANDTGIVFRSYEVL